MITNAMFSAVQEKAVSGFSLFGMHMQVLRENHG